MISNKIRQCIAQRRVLFTARKDTHKLVSTAAKGVVRQTRRGPEEFRSVKTKAQSSGDFGQGFVINAVTESSNECTGVLSSSFADRIFHIEWGRLSVRFAVRSERRSLVLPVNRKICFGSVMRRKNMSDSVSQIEAVLPGRQWVWIPDLSAR